MFSGKNDDVFTTRNTIRYYHPRGLKSPIPVSKGSSQSDARLVVLPAREAVQLPDCRTLDVLAVELGL